MHAPWRDARSSLVPASSSPADDHQKGAREEDPRAQLRVVSPGFFAALGVPLIAGRDFNDDDKRGGEPVVIISQSVAQRMFPGQDPINRHIMWTDPVMKFICMGTGPRRIVGVVADMDDEHLVPDADADHLHPFGQIPDVTPTRRFAVRRPAVRAHAHGSARADHSDHANGSRHVRRISRSRTRATLEDIRAEVLTPDRLNSMVFGGMAVVALAIAVVGVAGVLAFSVSGRTREFGIRLAVGAQPRHLLMGVIGEGVVMAVTGVIAGAVFGYGLTRLASRYFPSLQMPSALPVVGLGDLADRRRRDRVDVSGRARRAS